MGEMKKEEKERTSRFPLTQSQNPLQPHPASRSSKLCTSSTHSFFHRSPRREMIISLTSWIEFSTLSCEISKAEKTRGRVGEEKKLWFIDIHYLSVFYLIDLGVEVFDDRL